MDRHATIQILLRGSHLHRHPETLQHLARSPPHNVNPHHLLFGPDTHHLERARGLLLRRIHHREVHIRETCIVNLNILIAVLDPCVRFRQARGADLRVREDNAGNLVVLQLRVGLTPEQAVGEAAPSGDGHGRQLEALVAHVAQGEDVRDVGGLVVVHGDVAALPVELDARLVEPEVLNLRRAAYRPEDDVRIEGALAC